MQTRSVTIRHRNEEAARLLADAAATCSGCALAEKLTPGGVLVLGLCTHGDDWAETARRDIESLARTLDKHPNIAAIVVGPPDDATMVMAAMRAGASEYVACDDAPPEKGGDHGAECFHTEFAGALGRVCARAQQAEALAAAAMAHAGQASGGDILSVAGAKGGMGTTTVAVNLAAELERAAPGSTVLLDLATPRGEVSLFLDMACDYDWSVAAENPDRMDETFVASILSRHKSGLAVLAAPPPAHPGAHVPELTAESAATLATMLAARFSHVVVDAGQGYTPAQRGVMKISRRTLLVTALSLPALAGARQFYDTRSAETQNDSGLDGDESILTIANRHLSRSEIDANEAGTVLGAPLFETIANDYAATLSAINQGLPLATCAPKSAATKDIKRLAKRLCLLTAAKQDPRTTSLLSKLTFGLLGKPQTTPPATGGRLQAQQAMGGA